MQDTIGITTVSGDTVTDKAYNNIACDCLLHSLCKYYKELKKFGSD